MRLLDNSWFPCQECVFQNKMVLNPLINVITEVRISLNDRDPVEISRSITKMYYSVLFESGVVGSYESLHMKLPYFRH